LTKGLYYYNVDRWHRENTLHNSDIWFYRLIYWNITGWNQFIKAAGIGGGPILNICLMLGLGYETKSSMAITYVFLIGGSVASICCNYGIRNKAGTKNLIDYNLVIITLPMTVSGSIFGVIITQYRHYSIISSLSS
jgi:hypothetical protein